METVKSFLPTFLVTTTLLFICHISWGQPFDHQLIAYNDGDFTAIRKVSEPMISKDTMDYSIVKADLLVLGIENKPWRMPRWEDRLIDKKKIRNQHSIRISLNSLKTSEVTTLK